MTPAIRLAAIALGLLLAAAVADARELYLATDGDDGADGTSWEDAWRTPARSFAALRPGDVLTIGDGHYAWGGRVAWRGEPDARIGVRAQHPGRVVLDGGVRIRGWKRAAGLRDVWVAPVPGEKPVLLCSEADTGRVLHEATLPVECDGRLGCWAFDASKRLLYLRTSTGLPPERHVVETSFEPWGLFLEGTRDDPARQVDLRGLTLKNHANAGIRTNHGRNIVIEDCRVLQAGYGIELWYSSFTKVRRCEVSATYYQRYSEAGGIMFHGTAEYSLAEHNYVHDTPQDGIRAYSGGSRGTRFLHNLVVGARDPMYFKGGRSLGVPDRNVVVGGRWFGLTGDRPTHTGANTLIGVRAPLEISPRDLVVKESEIERARFADPAYHDYRLQSDSPHRRLIKGAHPYRGEVRFVGPGGSDERDGTSVARRWRTLAHATASLLPGQTLYLMTGVYREPLVLRRGGTRDEPVAIRARGRRSVVIEGASPGILLENAPFVSVEGIELRGSQGAGIALRGSPDASLVRVVARDGEVGVRAEASPRGLLAHALLNDNADAGVELAGGSPGWFVHSTAFARNGRALAVSGESRDRAYSEHNAFDLRGGGALGSWGDARAADLESWRELSGLDRRSVAGAIAPDADSGVEPGSLLAGSGWLASPVGPGELRLEPPAPSFDDVEVAWVGARSALVTWSTPRREERTFAWYGEGLGLEHAITGPEGTFHSVTLSDLEPDTRYRVRVGGDWRHPELPPAVDAQGVVPIRKFSELAGPLAKLEARGVASGISPAIEFRTRAEPPPARTLHVSTRGDDAADGLRRGSAWRTLSKAALKARPGDEVVVQPGVYEESFVPASGGATRERRITYRAASDEPVVLSGSERRRKWAIRLRGRRHLTFEGFHFVGHQDLEFGQVMLDGMNEDVVFRRCFFDGRGGNSGGIRTRYNSTNEATVEDSAFLYNWRAISWYFGSLTVRHVVFDMGIFSHVYLFRKQARLSLHDSVATSAGRDKTEHSGHLIVAESPRDVREDHNRFFFQPYDERRFLYRWGAHPYERDVHVYRGAEGLARWRADTGQGAHTEIIEDPRFSGFDALERSVHPKPDEPPRRLDAYRPAADSPLRGAASDGGDVGIRFPGAG